MNVPFVDLKRAHAPLREAFRGALDEVVENNQFILASPVVKFEQEFAAFVGSRFAVGVASGTDALHLSLRAAGIGAGDEVLVPAMTFAATALAVLYAGATPVSVDVDEQNVLIDLADAERALTARTRAIIPVHLYGQPCDMPAVMAFAKRHRLVVIEDACQSHGAGIGGKTSGTFGLTGCFSFYPSKNLGALGDGGLIVTDDESVQKKLLMLRNYGQPKKYFHDTLGFNSRLDGLQAAVLRLKLKTLAEGNAARQRHAVAYRKALAGLPLQVLGETHDTPNSIYHLYVVRTPRRDALMAFLQDRGIETGIHYPIPIPRHGFMTALGPQRACSVADRLANEICSLPMFPELSAEEISYVAVSIANFFSISETCRPRGS